MFCKVRNVFFPLRIETGKRTNRALAMKSLKEDTFSVLFNSLTFNPIELWIKLIWAMIYYNLCIMKYDQIDKKKITEGNKSVQREGHFNRQMDSYHSQNSV